LEIEIEEMWQLMMKQFKWRKMEVAASKINQKLKQFYDIVIKEKKIA